MFATKEASAPLRCVLLSLFHPMGTTLTEPDSYINQMKGNRCVWWQLHFLLATHFPFIPELCSCSSGLCYHMYLAEVRSIMFSFPSTLLRPTEFYLQPAFSHTVKRGDVVAPGLLLWMASCLQVLNFLLLPWGNRETWGSSSLHHCDADGWIRENFKGRQRTPGSDNFTCGFMHRLQMIKWLLLRDFLGIGLN